MTRLRVLVVALVLAAAVACEDEASPDIADPTPSSTAPSPSETESSPTTSPTTAALTPEETVRAWVDAWNEALRSGDTRDLQELGTPACRNCMNYVATINDVLGAGGQFSGGEWSIVEMSAELTGAESAKVVVGMAVASGATTNAAGEEPVVFEEDRRGLVYELTRQDVGWLVDAIDLLS